MEVPEWVRVVSDGSGEELRNFISANPGFDWDTTSFSGLTAFAYIWRHSAYPLFALQTLHDLGGASFSTRFCKDALTPWEVVAQYGSSLLAAWLLQHDVKIDSPAVLEGDAAVREMILDHSTTLTKEIVVHALTRAKDPKTYECNVLNVPEHARPHNSFLRWLASHDRREDGRLCVAWTLSQLTGTMWPDTREQLLERLMATRVREW